MEVHDGPISGLKIIKINILGDSRGFFAERFHAEKFAAAGLPSVFVQDNHSRSAPGILRGLHYQYAPPQGKLVGVTRGRIWDIAVDIRPRSSTFGKHYAIELSDENGLLLWMPPGFAHGFCVLGDEVTDVLYKVTGIYNSKGEGGIRYDDATLNIPWPINNPLVSERDKNAPDWHEFIKIAPAWENVP